MRNSARGRPRTVRGRAGDSDPGPDADPPQAGVKLSVPTVWQLLKWHDRSWQAPARRARERDEHAVELWKKELRPQVKASRRRPGPGPSSRTAAASLRRRRAPVPGADADTPPSSAAAPADVSPSPPCAAEDPASQAVSSTRSASISPVSRAPARISPGRTTATSWSALTSSPAAPAR
ncbi:helix-turn-helix domain-containing protein [Streptomyces sp. NPDC055085]